MGLDKDMSDALHLHGDDYVKWDFLMVLFCRQQNADDNIVFKKWYVGN